MRFDDLALQYNFQVPLGWVYDVERSHLITVIFRHWDRHNEWVSVRAVPAYAAPDASLDEWHAALDAKVFPPRMRPVQRTFAGRFAAALAEAHEQNPAPVHRRIMLVRGARLDLHLEHSTPEPSAGPLHSQVLRVIGDSLDIPTNRFLPGPVEQGVVMHDLDLASQAIQRSAWNEATDSALRALGGAQTMYLHSVVANRLIPEIPAVMAQMRAALNLTQATGSVLFARGAEHLGMRALYTLERLPFLPAIRRSQVAKTLKEGIQANVNLQISITHPTRSVRASAGVGVAHRRSDYLLRQAQEQRGAGDSRYALMLCEAAVADLLMVFQAVPQTVEAVDPSQMLSELAEKLTADGATTLEQKRELWSGLVTRTKLADLTQALRMLADLRLIGDDFVAALEANEFLLSVLDRLEPPQVMSFGPELLPPADFPVQKARALMASAACLAEIGDSASLDEAQRLLDQAEGLFDDLKGKSSLVAELSLLRASMLHSERKLDGALENIERGLAAAADAELATTIVPELKTIKSQFLLNAGQLREARELALEVVSSAEGESPRAVRNRAAHYLNLAIIDMRLGQFEEAAKSLRQALDRAVRMAAFGEAAYRILMVSSQLFASRQDGHDDAALAYDLNTAALANLDARYSRISVDSARVGFDEAGLHRQAFEELISGLVDRGAWAEAAATADRSRARSLIRLIAPPPEAAGPPRGNQMAPPHLASLELTAAFREAVNFIVGSADAEISQTGAYRPLSPERIRQVAGQIGSACLLIQPVKGRIALIVIRQDGEVTGAYSDKAYAESLHAMQTVREQMEAGPADLPALQNALGTLWSALIAPVIAAIGESEPLMIVPYRDFALLPFALLTDPAGRQLVDQRAFAVTPSLADDCRFARQMHLGAFASREGLRRGRPCLSIQIPAPEASRSEA